MSAITFADSSRSAMSSEFSMSALRS
jgi:hypothetical protein